MSFAFRLAWREARSSLRRIGVYGFTISLGVAVLVATNSLRSSVADSIDAEARALLGADLRLSSGRALPDSVNAVLDSATAAGIPVSRVTGTVTLALGETGSPRLVQLRAIDGGYPFYGALSTQPPGMREALDAERVALVEPDVLAALGIATNDSIRLGTAWFRVTGTLHDLPPEFGFRSAIGPRVFIANRWLEETGVVQYGSLLRHEAYLHIPDDTRLERFVDVNHALFRRHRVRFDTAAEEADELAEAVEFLGRFLGLVGLMALLLGGLGVASAIHVYIAGKRATIAVLRCLGATQRTAFVAYLLQATAPGIA